MENDLLPKIKRILFFIFQIDCLRALGQLGNIHQRFQDLARHQAVKNKAGFERDNIFAACQVKTI